MNTETKNRILAEAVAASEGAIQRAANRGWSLKEQARCGKEAAKAVFDDNGTSWKKLTK